MDTGRTVYIRTCRARPPGVSGAQPVERDGTPTNPISSSQRSSGCNGAARNWSSTILFPGRARRSCIVGLLALNLGFVR